MLHNPEGELKVYLSKLEVPTHPEEEAGSGILSNVTPTKPHLYLPTRLYTGYLAEVDRYIADLRKSTGLNWRMPSGGINVDLPVFTLRNGRKTLNPDPEIGEELFIAYIGGHGFARGTILNIVNSV